LATLVLAHAVDAIRAIEIEPADAIVDLPTEDRNSHSDEHDEAHDPQDRRRSSRLRNRARSRMYAERC
jgi:hypothetical protein